MARANVSWPVSRPEAQKTGKATAPGTGRGKTPATGRARLQRPDPITWATANCHATATGWHFALPVPERTNAIWRQWKGRTLVSAKHRADKQTAPGRFPKIRPYPGDVAVRLEWVRERRSGDVDGRVKATLDLLTAIGIWSDDAQVQRLEVERIDDPTRAAGMYVWVEASTTTKVAA